MRRRDDIFIGNKMIASQTQLVSLNDDDTRDVSDVEKFDVLDAIVSSHLFCSSLLCTWNPKVISFW
jgi:hypothetical protein